MEDEDTQRTDATGTTMTFNSSPPSLSKPEVIYGGTKQRQRESSVITISSAESISISSESSTQTYCASAVRKSLETNACLTALPTESETQTTDPFPSSPLPRAVSTSSAINLDPPINSHAIEVDIPPHSYATVESDTEEDTQPTLPMSSFESSSSDEELGFDPSCSTTKVSRGRQKQEKLESRKEAYMVASGKKGRTWEDFSTLGSFGHGFEKEVEL